MENNMNGELKDKMYVLNCLTYLRVYTRKRMITDQI